MADYISRINDSNIGGIFYIQDVSSIHDMIPGTSTYTLVYGYKDSKYKSTSTLLLPSDVLFYTDTDAITYKQNLSGAATSPGTSIPASKKGWLYKVDTSGYVATVRCDVNDIIICNTTTTTSTTSPANFDFFQGNIESSTYSLKGHTHSVNLTITSSGVLMTKPSGTISVSVIGKTTTATGSNTPLGTISASFSVSASHDHTFSGTEKTITLSYTKATGDTKTTTPTALTNANSSIYPHNYTPKGTITTTVTDDPNALMSIGGSATQSPHNHTFYGTPATITITYDKAPSNTSVYNSSVIGTMASHAKYTPAGSISTPTISVDYQSHTASFTRATTFNTYTTYSAETSTGTKAFVNLSYDASDENLTFVKDTLTYANTSTVVFNKPTLSGIIVSKPTMNASTPIFTGSSHTFTHSLSGLSLRVHTHTMSPISPRPTTTASYTPEGTIDSSCREINISQITLKYNKVTDITMAFAGDASTMKHDYSMTLPSHLHDINSSTDTSSFKHTTAGTISSDSMTFNANTNNKSITMTFYGTAATYTMSGTPLFTASASILMADLATHTHVGTLSTTIGTLSV